MRIKDAAHTWCEKALCPFFRRAIAAFNIVNNFIDQSHCNHAVAAHGVELKDFGRRQFIGFTPSPHGLVDGVSFQTDLLAAFSHMIKKAGNHHRKT
jgi:hypothetical protein